MTRTRLFLILAAAFMLLLSAAGAATAQTGQSPLPKPTGYVNDYAGVIDSATKAQLETTLGNLDRQQQIQISVVTVDTTGGQEIFDYSLAVARGWGIGSKETQKPSLLLLAVIKDRKAFTQVSRHLEGDIPDGLAGQIQREQLVPAFRAGDYGRGLADTVNTFIATIASKQGFSTDAIFPAGTTRTPQRPAERKTSSWAPCGIVIFVIVILVIMVIRSRGRGGPRSGSGGGWLGWLVLSTLLNSGSRSGSSGWGGGGFGGFSGGGSSGGSSGGGFGGFGGGGDFGGGGAGVSW